MPTRVYLSGEGALARNQRETKPIDLSSLVADERYIRHGVLFASCLCTSTMTTLVILAHAIERMLYESSFGNMK